ncbi:MAG: CCA tRNA nucleotidyltransferase [Candidatus Bilamarchaeaceae archaeon]
MKILKEVVKKLRPSPDEVLSLQKTVRELRRRLGKATEREIALVGSVAKKTFLSGEGDVDLFILFDERLDKEKIKTELESIFRKAFPGYAYQMNYAEHPYIRFHFGARRIDLVPAYKTKNAKERLTAVDRSVLHTRFILRNLKKSQRDEVRLLKKFLKANELYGAEIRVEGLSGYLCELLIIRYGSFRRLLKAVLRWKLPMVIDIKGYYKGLKKDELIKRFNSRFVVIDPTDKNRNVAAALSEDNLKRFISLCKKFNKKPREVFFFKKPESFDEKVRRRNGIVRIIEMPRAEVVDDILWGQLKKFMRTLRTELSDFDVKDIFADSNDIVKIAIVTKKAIVGGTMEKKGPPIEMSEHVKNFRRAHKGQRVINRGGRAVAIVRVQKKTLGSALRQIILVNKKRFNHLSLAKATVEPK